jgi:hypothetical protein
MLWYIRLSISIFLKILLKDDGAAQQQTAATARSAQTTPREDAQYDSLFFWHFIPFFELSSDQKKKTKRWQRNVRWCLNQR